MARHIAYGEGQKILAKTLSELRFCRTIDEVAYARRLACKYKSNLDTMYCMQHHGCRGCCVDRACNNQKRMINSLNTILSVTY